MRTVLITGIGRGIGRALAQKFLAEGFQVFGTSQTGTVDYSADNLKAFKLDLASTDSIKNCAEAIEKVGVKIDILINNAGVLFDDEDTRLIAEKLRKTLEVNLTGTADFTEQIIKDINQKDAHIIFISSAAGSLIDMDNVNISHFPYHYPAYKISKCAINMYMRTLATRLNHEGTGIIVSSVHPGWVKTAIGGDEAPMTPEEAAADIFKLAVSRPETGQFWYKGKKYPW